MRGIGHLDVMGGAGSSWLFVRAPRGSWLHSLPSVSLSAVRPSPSREVTRGEAMNEAVCPPGLGHHCPLGAPKDPPDGEESGSQPRASTRHIPTAQGRGKPQGKRDFPLFWRFGEVTAPPGWLCPLRAGMGHTFPRPASFP